MYLDLFGLGQVDEFTVLGLKGLEVLLSVAHHLHYGIECVDSLGVLLDIYLVMYRFGILYLDPLLALIQHLINIPLLLL